MALNLEYNKFIITMNTNDKKMNRTDWKEASGISFNVLAKMGKNEFISMESLMKICATLKCNVGDIVEFFPESEELHK